MTPVGHLKKAFSKNFPNFKIQASSSPAMIRTTIAFVLLFGLQALQAQSLVTVKGKITHPADEYVYIRYYADLLTFDEVTADSARLDDEGRFEMTFACPPHGEATFYHGDEITEMYLVPGDDLYLTLDTKAFDESLTYSGPGAQRHNYLAARMLVGLSRPGTRHVRQGRGNLHHLCRFIAASPLPVT